MENHYKYLPAKNEDFRMTEAEDIRYPFLCIYLGLYEHSSKAGFSVMNQGGYLLLDELETVASMIAWVAIVIRHWLNRTTKLMSLTSRSVVEIRLLGRSRTSRLVCMRVDLVCP